MTPLARTLLAVAGAGALVGCGAGSAAAPPRALPAPREGAVVPSPVRPAEEPPPAPPPTPRPPAPIHVVLVTLDGIRWQDVFHEEPLPTGGMPVTPAPPDAVLMPRTLELVEKSGLAFGRGAGCGVVRARNGTNISLPAYLEIFTGRRTGCMSNVCPNVREPTVLDAAASAGITTASIGSWEMLAAAVSNGTSGAFVSAGVAWPGPRPLEDRRLEDLVAEGTKAKPFPASGGTYRPDRLTGAIALEYLRARRPRFFHVGLGDADEYAHRDDRAGYAAAVRDADAFLGALARQLEELDLFESTIVIVTADHGRANVFREHGPTYPESARSFVVAFGGRAPRRGEICASRDVWLTDLATTVRALFELPRDASADGAVIEELVTP